MIRETTADIIRRRRGMRPMDDINAGMQQPQTVQVDVPQDFRAQEQALGQPDPADVEQAAAMLQEQAVPRPGSVPAQVGQQMTAAAPPDNRDEEEMAAAQEADRASGLSSGLELAGRQLVGGITRTPVGQSVGRAPSQVPYAQAAAKSRAERAAEVVRMKRQGAQDQRQAGVDESEAELRRARGDALAREKGGEGDAWRAEQAGKKSALDAERLAFDKDKEDFRRANPKKAAPKADRSLEDIPPGYEVEAGAQPSGDSRRKFSALLVSAEKMRGLTEKMRGALKGTSGFSRVFDPETKTALRQIATMMRIEGKNVADLGALSGPDMALMDAIAQDPTSVMTNLTTDLPKMLDTLDDWGNRSVAAGSRTYGIRAKGGTGKSAGGAKPTSAVKTMKLPSGEIVEVE